MNLTIQKRSSNSSMIQGGGDMTQESLQAHYLGVEMWVGECVLHEEQVHIKQDTLHVGNALVFF